MIGVLVILVLVALCAFAIHRIGSPYADETHPRHT
jgi:hypothetical protein